MTIGDHAATRAFWDSLYTRFARNEPGPVNRYLISEVERLSPGTALDLGCADGADALWLAERGWRVTAVDVSPVALGRARAFAIQRGLDDRIAFLQHDLATSFPEGEFDLVSAQFLHSPIGGPAERLGILARAAAAVAPGGQLLVVSHQSVPAWHPSMPGGLTAHPLNLAVPTPQENLAALQLADGKWEAVRTETVAIELTSPSGEPGIREDQVLHYRRMW